MSPRRSLRHAAAAVNEGVVAGNVDGEADHADDHGRPRARIPFQERADIDEEEESRKSRQEGAQISPGLRNEIRLQAESPKVVGNDPESGDENGTQKTGEEQALLQEVGGAVAPARAYELGAHAGQGEKASYGEKGGRLPDGTADCHSGHGFGAVMTGHDGVREIHADLGKLGDENGQAYAQGAACLGFGEEKGHGSGRGIGGCWMRDCMAVCLTSVRWRRNRTRIGFSPLPTPAFPSPARKSGEGVFSFS